jgi:mono/diheme cytochrome c family protein
MTRVEITVGLLAILGTVGIVALVGLGEPARMPTAELGFTMRKVESGAQLYDQYCSSCHGQNAAGGVCPPLNETSGLYGGDVGEGVAWRLEELGWDPRAPYEYVVSAIASGRSVSTRPEQYPGNRIEGAGPVMAMPAWSQRSGGPLRDDQVYDIAAYLTNFREFIPDDVEEAKKVVGEAPAPVATASLAASEPVTVTLAPTVELTAGDVARGEALFVSATCVACHALPGVGEAIVGPSQVGLFGRIDALLASTDYAGLADTPELYVYESLRAPNAHVVPEFAVNGRSSMVAFGPERLSDQDIADLIAYLRQFP